MANLFPGLGLADSRTGGSPTLVPTAPEFATLSMPRQRAPEAQTLASALMAFLNSLTKVTFPFLIILAAVFLYTDGPECSLKTIKSLVSPVVDHTPTSPYSASWRSWFHPFQRQSGSRYRSLKKKWNVLHHLGGNGPWVEMLDEGGISPDLAPPPGCVIDQVHMVCRYNDLKCSGESMLNDLRCRGMPKDILRRLLGIVRASSII
jgi:hypothetical protein